MTVESWHAVATEDCARRLDVDLHSGLPEAEARARLLAQGDNVLPEPQRAGPLRLLLEQLSDFMILMLIAAALIAAAAGDPADSVAILAIVVLNAAVGVIQSWRADRTLEALGRLAVPRAVVLRGGHEQTVAAAALVRGDVVLLEAGERVPADLRLFDAQQIECDESMLTGESTPVAKTVAAVAAERPLAERLDMAYSGSLVVRGRGRGLVTATGADTELGRIAGLLSRQSTPPTPLQRRLARFGRQLTVGVLLVAALVFLGGVLRNEPLLPMLLTALSLAVAAIPEALPAVMTVALALGAGRMAQRQALLRRLPAVETLGSVTAICSDKTGTLTLNRMQVQEAVLPGGAHVPAALLAAQAPDLCRAMVLNNDADGAGKAGDPTERALVEAVAAAGGDVAGMRRDWPRVAELPFDSATRRMLSVHQLGENEHLVLLKGAPEALLELCRDDERRLAEAGVQDLAAAGCRVLAFAQGRHQGALPEDLRLLESGAGLEWLGLVGMLDPPRPEAAAAVAAAAAAGIDTYMITGDHPSTALAIAARVGIVGAGVLTGAQIAALDRPALGERLRSVRVLARMTPEQKIEVVQALRARGEVVAVTGDGVNDAPALRSADIGVAMGLGGTDVAREAADLVLLDDHFATLVDAIREGRRIYDNLRKFLRYALTTNASELLVLALAPLFGLPLPLTAIQILWINLISDGLPGVALATDPSADDAMRRPPRPVNESLLARGLGWYVLFMGLLIAALVLGVQVWALHTVPAHAQTLVFTTMVFTQLAQALSARSGTAPALGRGLLANPFLLLAVVASALVQVLVLYLPLSQEFLGIHALPPTQLGIAVAVASVVLLVGEIGKKLSKRL